MDSKRGWMIGSRHLPVQSSSTHLMEWITTGRLVTVSHNGGALILKHSWCVFDACHLSVRLKYHISSSILSYLRILPNQKSAKSFFWSRCLSEVGAVYLLYPIPLTHFTLEVLAVPKNMKLLAIPLFELYDNAARYVQDPSCMFEY
jgi:hypothetical protein